MKIMKRIPLFLIFLLGALTCLAQDKGLGIGVFGSVSTDRYCGNQYWAVGAAVDYKVPFNQSFFFNPEIALGYERHAKIDYNGLPKDYGFHPDLMTMYVSALAGINLGKGWSVLTGPQGQFQLIVDDPHKNFKYKRAALFWDFGIAKSFNRVFVKASYDQHITDNDWNENLFRLTVGYRF